MERSSRGEVLPPHQEAGDNSCGRRCAGLAEAPGTRISDENQQAPPRSHGRKAPGIMPTFRRSNVSTFRRSLAVIHQSPLPSFISSTSLLPFASPLKNLRPQLAGGEGLQGTKASDQFPCRQTPLAVEPANIISRGALPLPGVAFQAARNEVAERIAPRLHARHDMVQRARPTGDAAQTIKAHASFARVDRLAPCAGVQEIQVVESGAGRQPGRAAGAYSVAAHGRDLVGQPHLDHVTLAAAVEQSKNAVIDKPAY